MLRTFVLLFSLFLFSAFTWKQETLKKGVNTVHQDSLVSSFVLDVSANINVRVVINNDTLQSLIDEHTGTSILFMFDEPTNEILLLTDDTCTVGVSTFYVEPMKGSSRKSSQITNYCETQPYTILQSEWRAGLANPKSGRVFTETEHLIIHHSAGSNTATNYTNVVRNIYTYHTEGNGWDDIGYNYVIAQDGTIFTGRDPQGVSDQDNVQGAHYCANNGSTMGVCLLGTYTSIYPTAATLTSLYDLLTWKVIKEGFEVYDSQIHVSNGVNTPRITGHRHACNTSCPGDKTWELIPSIRDSVNVRVAKCNEVEEVEDPIPFEYSILLNPVNRVFFIQSEVDFDEVTLVDLDGLNRAFSTSKISDNLYEIRVEWTGIAILTLLKDDEKASELVFLK